MTINYAKKLEGTGIDIVGHHKYYYEWSGITIEIGGIERFTDPSIWRFETRVLAQHFFNQLFKVPGMKKALRVLNDELAKFKQKNGDLAKENLHKLSSRSMYRLLDCIGYEGPNDHSSVLLMQEQCGKNYNVAVHEKVACFLLGFERETKCHTCKMAKYDPESGWLKCDKIVQKIPKEQIGNLPDFMTGEFNMKLYQTSNNEVDMYTDLCLFDIPRCHHYRTRLTPKATLIEAFNL